MSVTTIGFLYAVAAGSRASSEYVALTAAAQAGATRVNNVISRVIRSIATGSLILPSILTGEANEPIYVVNDSPNSVNVYPAVGEKTNGNANTAVAVAAGAVGVFIPILSSTNNPTTLDWRTAVIS
jgi:hypothetical protein